MNDQNSVLTTLVSDKPFLSVVIPAYNESVNVKHGVLDRVANYLSSQTFTYEVLLVDDGSTDDTLNLLQRFANNHKGFRVIKDTHTGKAFTVIRGLEEAQGEIVMFMDMDQATPIDELEKLLPEFEKGFDVVIGSRGSVRKNAPVLRQIMSKSQMLLRNIILGFREVTDTQCGFKAFKSNTIKHILSKLYIFNSSRTKEISRAAVTAGFDVELLFVAKQLGYKIKEVEVDWDYKRSRRVNMLRDSINGVLELLYLKWLSVKGLYK